MLSLIIKELEANEISTMKSLWCILKCLYSWKENMKNWSLMKMFIITNAYAP